MATAIMPLTFNDVKFDVVDQNGQPWIQSRQLANALGYKDENSVRRIYERNKDEFTLGMSTTVKLTVGGTPVDVRIFSLRGCHLLAMFARTPVAKAFRVWVLDILESLNANQQEKLVSSATLTPDQCRTIQNMVDALAGKGFTHAAVYSRFKNHFRIPKYDQLPASKMSEAVQYLMNLDPIKPIPSAQIELPPADDLQLAESLLREMEQCIKTFRALDSKFFGLITYKIKPWKRYGFGPNASKDTASIEKLRTADCLGNALHLTFEAFTHHCRSVLAEEHA